MSRRDSVLQGIEFKGMDFSPHFEAMRITQQERENQERLNQQNQLNKQKSSDEASKFIGDIKLEHIGDNTIDLYNDAQIKKLQDELNGMQAKGATLPEIRLKAQQDLYKISQGYTIAKNGYGKIKSGLADLGKDYPTGKLETARNIAGQEFLKDIFDYNEDGTVKGYKDISLIPQDKDYMGMLLQGKNLEQWYTPSGKFADEVKSKPLTPISGGTKRTDARGRMVDQTYTGHTSVFDEPVLNKEGNATGLKLKSEEVPLATNPDGSISTITVMPKEQFSLATDTPGALADFTVMFRKEMKQRGIDPDQLDPRSYDVMQRKFALDYFDRTKIHGSSFLPKDIEKAAPIKIYNNSGSGGGKGNDTQIRDVFNEINKKYENGTTQFGSDYRIPLNELSATAQGIAIKYANELTKSDPPYSQRGIYITKGQDGNFNIVEASSGNVIAPMDFTDINIKAQAGVPEKREVVEQAKKMPKEEPKPQTQNKWDKYKRN